MATSQLVTAALDGLAEDGTFDAAVDAVSLGLLLFWACLALAAAVGMQNRSTQYHSSRWSSSGSRLPPGYPPRKAVDTATHPHDQTTHCILLLTQVVELI
jgi:hypothetical protein